MVVLHHLWCESRVSRVGNEKYRHAPRRALTSHALAHHVDDEITSFLSWRRLVTPSGKLCTSLFHLLFLFSSLTLALHLFLFSPSSTHSFSPIIFSAFPPCSSLLPCRHAPQWCQPIMTTGSVVLARENKRLAKFLPHPERNQETLRYCSIDSSFTLYSYTVCVCVYVCICV